MRTVTDAFVLQELKQSPPVTYLYYKRRYWNAATSAYIYEASWTKLERSEVVSIGAITQNLDTETLSEFQISNVQVTLKNSSNEWKETNASGKFAADGVSANGYEPYLMKFQVRTGFANVGETDIRQGARTGGTEELITIFTGVANGWQFDSESGVVSVDIQGAERLLQNADATRVCNTVTNESLGTGDGETKEFYTANAGVGKIVNVIVNSVTLTAGIDYEISQLNDIENGAQITFAEAPASTHTITCSYEHWKKNELLENLVEDLVDEAGITSKAISSATLGSIQNNISHSSKADWDTGTSTGFDKSKYGVLQTDYNSSSRRSAVALDDTVPNRFSVKMAAEAYSWSISGATLTGEDGVGGDTQGRALSIKTAPPFINGYVSGFGSWKFKLKTSAGGGTVKIWILNGTTIDASADAYNGYFLKLSESSFSFGHNEKDTTTETILFSDTTNVLTTSYKTFEARITKDGIIKIYCDSVLIGTEENTEYTLGSRFLIYAVSGDLIFETIEYPNETALTYSSGTIDTKGGITAWGNLSFDYENIAISNIETRVSSDNTNWDAWVAATGYAINSAVKQYIQVRFEFEAYSCVSSVSGGAPAYPWVANERITDDQYLHSFTVEFTSPKVLVCLAGFESKSCYDALQELCKLVPTYEWGLDANEQFFFRVRNDSATPDVTFVQNSNLSNIVYLKYDYENMYSIVRAEFGDFVSEASDADGVRTSILEIIGKKVFSVGSGVLLNKDTNIAAGIASTYLTRLKKKRRRGRIQTKYYPQVELSDTISVTYKRDPYPAVEQFIEALICNVIGVTHDPENALSEFEIEEIVA